MSKVDAAAIEYNKSGKSFDSIKMAFSVYLGAFEGVTQQNIEKNGFRRKKFF